MKKHEYEVKANQGYHFNQPQRIPKKKDKTENKRPRNNKQIKHKRHPTNSLLATIVKSCK
jgi:hypothetical protein